MPQLLVRDLELAVVKKLRSRAAAQGVSVEEAHRRVLREALMGDRPGPQRDFLAYLRSIPPGNSVEFPRSGGLPRKIAL